MQKRMQHKLPDSTLKKRLDAMHKKKINYSVPDYEKESQSDIFSFSIFYGHILQWAIALGLGVLITLLTSLSSGQLSQYIDKKVSTALTEGTQLTWELVEEWVNELRKNHISSEDN
ncbi:hypothetical protein PRVXH_001105 [Proteinivorax hydrogeniformans]|uniref:Uncharacterized protein n=1 Tax=Proteinivorax hydrogeniformans TaxID=1826727 RepID=A0AAU8HWG8_9FIRM